jgi:hypothetical protein
MTAPSEKFLFMAGPLSMGATLIYILSNIQHFQGLGLVIVASLGNFVFPAHTG